MLFRLLMTKGDYFYCILGAVGNNGKVYFCTDDVALAIQRNKRWAVESATCRMNDITNKCKLRPKDWVIEFSALLNLLKLERERRLYYLLQFGRVKEVVPTTTTTTSSSGSSSSGSSSGSMVQVEECKDREGILFESWIRDFKQKCAEEESENRLCT